MEYLAKTCGLIISYNPSNAIIKNTQDLSTQVDKLIIIDNGSSESNRIDYLREHHSSGLIQVLFNKQNLGIAAALNQGIDIAIKEGYEWIVTFDQDTSIPEKFINSLFNCYENFSSKQDIAILCPVQMNYDCVHPSNANSNGYKYISSTMTSGSLMQISAIQKIGLFDESLFIDWVDHDYCMRAKAANYKIVQSINTPLVHSAGDLKQHLVFGKKIDISNHSPLRRYYIYRNRAICYQRYLTLDPLFVIDDFFLALKEFVKIILFEEDRLAKLWMIYIGIKDAFLNKKGSYFDNHVK